MLSLYRPALLHLSHGDDLGLWQYQVSVRHGNLE